jgi:quinol monooxygenase YgiN
LRIGSAGVEQPLPVRKSKARESKGEDGMLRHVAMFKWKEGVTDDQKTAARDALAALKQQVPSVVEYTVGFDIERNPNNWDMVLVADFEDVAGLESYFADPIMNAASDLVASVTQKDITARVQFLF